ncbi:MAG TPA: hypothetical protein VFU46_03405 [Gemmatimonadales bacterium]|nr:hypothetical protein [Gemmatimonadales bacterium]
MAGEIGGFFNAVNDFIYPRPTGRFDDDPADPGASGNQEYEISQGDARFYGFEGTVDWNPRSWVELRGTTDYVWAENRTLDQPLPWIPPFRVTYSVRFERERLGPLQGAYVSAGGESNGRQTRVDPNEFTRGSSHRPAIRWRVSGPASRYRPGAARSPWT